MHGITSLFRGCHVSATSRRKCVEQRNGKYLLSAARRLGREFSCCMPRHSSHRASIISVEQSNRMRALKHRPSTFAMAPQGSSLCGDLWRNNHTPNEIAWSIRAWSHPATVPPSLWIGFSVGVQVGDAACLPSIVPRILTSVLASVLTSVLTSRFLTSHLKQIVFLTRSRSRALVSGRSFNCFPPLSGRRRLRPAPSHPLSPGIPNLLAAANRRRCRTIERRRSPPTGVSHR